MSHVVLAATAAQRDFKRLPPEAKARVKAAMSELSENPRRKAQKLAAGEGYRVRVGDYRIVFRVDDDAREVLVTRVKHRRDVYRRR